MTESRESRKKESRKESRSPGRDETLEERFMRHEAGRSQDESSTESDEATETGGHHGGGDPAAGHWDNAHMLVPSSMEPGAVNRYVVSKQIRQMQEPRYLTPDDLAERRIIYPDSPDRKLVNRFRNLRTKLLEMSGHRNFALVVTGATEGAGASYIAMNLAAAFAFDESKTALLIDCNLREPSLHTALDMVPDAGLTDFLEEPDYDIARIIYPTGIPRLRLIPAGSRRESPGEFFTSFRMRQFMQAVRRRYPDRFIILDTASVGDSPDARILAELCDYSLLVVPHGRVTPSAIEQAAGAFQQEKFAGAIING